MKVLPHAAHVEVRGGVMDTVLAVMVSSFL
jgi:hypothetical protein